MSEKAPKKATKKAPKPEGAREGEGARSAAHASCPRRGRK